MQTNNIFFCRWLHGEVKLRHFIATTKKLFWVHFSAMNMFLVIQKENKDQQTPAGEIGSNGYVHDFVRVRGSWTVVSRELPLIVVLVTEMGEESLENRMEKMGGCL